jgi:hypothetical protein
MLACVCVFYYNQGRKPRPKTVKARAFLHIVFPMGELQQISFEFCSLIDRALCSYYIYEVAQMAKQWFILVTINHHG